VASASIAAVLAGTDPGRAARLAQAAEEAVNAEEDAPVRAVASASIAAVLAGTDPGRAAQMAREAEDYANTITEPRGRAQALADIAEVFADTEPERAARLAQEAAETARSDRSVPKTGQRRPVMARVAWTLAVPDSDRQAALAADPSGIGLGLEANLLSCLAEGLAAAKQYDAAEHAARATGTANLFTYDAYSSIAGPLAAAGLWDRAEQAAKHSGFYSGKALASMASAAAHSDPDRAVRLARQAEDAARAVSDSFWKMGALAGVAVALDAVDPARAIRLAQEVDQAESEEARWHAYKIIGVLAAHGERNRAEQLAGKMTDYEGRAGAVADISGALANAGHLDEAIRTAEALTPYTEGYSAARVEMQGDYR